MEAVVLQPFFALATHLLPPQSGPFSVIIITIIHHHRTHNFRRDQVVELADAVALYKEGATQTTTFAVTSTGITAATSSKVLGLAPKEEAAVISEEKGPR